MNRIATGPAVRLVLLTVAIIVLLLVAWVGRAIVMLLLASGILAVLVSAVVNWLTMKLKIRRGLAFALLLAAGFMVVFLMLWIRGPSIIEQFADLQTDLPPAAHKFLERLNGYQGGRWLLAQWSDYTQTSGNIGSALRRIGGFVLSTASVIGGLGLALFLGLYLAAEPQVYLLEFVGLSRRAIVPSSMRARKVLLEFSAGGSFRKRFR